MAQSSRTPPRSSTTLDMDGRADISQAFAPNASISVPTPLPTDFRTRMRCETAAYRQLPEDIERYHIGARNDPHPLAKQGPRQQPSERPLKERQGGHDRLSHTRDTTMVGTAHSVAKVALAGEVATGTSFLIEGVSTPVHNLRTSSTSTGPAADPGSTSARHRSHSRTGTTGRCSARPRAHALS